jgi:hypothetical protein
MGKIECDRLAVKVALLIYLGALAVIARNRLQTAWSVDRFFAACFL